MATVKKVEGYTEEQISSAKRLIDVLMGVPKEKQPLFTAITTAYMAAWKPGRGLPGKWKGLQYEDTGRLTLWRAGRLGSYKHYEQNIHEQKE